MPFSNDLDLLLLEPLLFRDVAWSGQTLVSATGASVAGTTLTSASSDFVVAGVAAGHVAMLGGAALEVVERLSATTLTVSRPRADGAEPVAPPLPGSDLPLLITTFAPQARIVHEQLLRALGLEPDSPPPPPGAVAASAITNPRALARVEALGALHLIFAAAGALAGEGSALWQRAAMHRERFAAERRRVGALIDLDGDGLPDATRRLNVLQLVRA